MNIFGRRNAMSNRYLFSVCALVLVILCMSYLASLNNNQGGTGYNIQEVIDKVKAIMATRDRQRHRHKSNDYADNYIRDQSGYIYHKDYFDLAYPGVTPSFKDMDFEGRHSDTVLPPCEKYPTGAGAKIGKQYDYRSIGPFNFSKDHKNPCWYEPSGKLRCVPYFYNLGTAKAGSSDLWVRQMMHPDIESHVLKERRFFDRERFKKKEWEHFDFYLSHYDKVAAMLEATRKKKGYSTRVFGDGSPVSSFNSLEWERFPGNEGCIEPRVIVPSYIHHMVPSAKIILIMRNPIDRLYSVYLFNYKWSKARQTPEEFHQWAKRSIEEHRKCFKTLPFRNCMYSPDLLNRTLLTTPGSIYSRIIMDLCKIFPRKQMFFIKLEDFSDRHNMSIRSKEMFDFLGVGPASQHLLNRITNIPKRNGGRFYGKSGPMFPKTRKMIYEFYKPFNEELAYILKDNKYLWKEDL